MERDEEEMLLEYSVWIKKLLRGFKGSTLNGEP
jgi:hypothetical protein